MSDRVLEFLARPEVWATVAGLTGFLTLTWLIRRAPLGQATRPEPTSAPGAGERDRAVVMAVGGFLLIALGGLLAVRSSIPVAIPAFAVGIGLVVWVIRRYRKDRHSSPTIRRLIAFAETALTASLLAGVLLVGNALAFRLGGQAIDLTHDRAFTLSSLTLNQVESLDRPVVLTVFFGNSERSIRQLDRVRQLADLLHAANPAKVRVEYLNPFTDIKEFEALAQRVPDVAASNGDGLVVSLGDTPDAPRAVLGTRELFEFGGGPGAGSGSTSTAERFTSTFRGEDAITSALIRLREGKRTRVAFTTGHGEASTAEMDLNRPGYGLWKARLSSVGSDVIEVNLLRDEIPPEVNLLVIGGPKAPFQEAEIDRIKRHISRGGAILALVDHLEPTGLDDLLATYNIRLGPGVAADSKYTFNNRPTIIYAPVASNLAHPITTPLLGQVVLLQKASPVQVIGVGGAIGAAAANKAATGDGGSTVKPTNPGIITTPILKTSPESWVESDPQSQSSTFDRGTEQAGPLVVGVAATTRPALASEPPTPRLVLFSTPTIGDNRLLRTDATNIDLLMNAVSWLRGKPEAIGIASKTHESLMFAADPGLQLRLVMVPTLAMVVVILGLGLSTYLARRD